MRPESNGLARMTTIREILFSGCSRTMKTRSTNSSVTWSSGTRPDRSWYGIATLERDEMECFLALKRERQMPLHGGISMSSTQLRAGSAVDPVYRKARRALFILRRLPLMAPKRIPMR